MVALLIVAGAVCFWGFKSGDSRSFQIAKNLDIFNSIVKELDMFYVDTIDPNKTIREGIDAMLYSLDDDHVRSMLELGMEHVEE